MRLTILAALTATSLSSARRVCAAPVADEPSAAPDSATPITWYSTAFVSDEYATLRLIQYDSTGVTPVPTSSLPEVIEATTLTQPTASRDINQTVLVTQTITGDLTTETIYVPITTPLPPHSTYANATTTSYSWTTSTIATVTLTETAAPAACDHEATTTTVTSYTGTYTPLPDQTTDSRTRFPTAVLTQIYNTVTYAVYPYTGRSVTHTDTETEFTYLTTETTTVTLSTAGGKYTSTIYEATATATRTEYQLGYETITTTITPSSECAPTVTITQAHKCAPTNLLSEQDGLGVAVRILPNEWSFPIGFPDTLIGIPGGGGSNGPTPTSNQTSSFLIKDASSCCQLCVENNGCAASEWAVETSTRGSCRLYFFNDPPAGQGNLDDHGIDGGIPRWWNDTIDWDTCGRRRTTTKGEGGQDGNTPDVVGLQYYASSFALPGQASYIQAGCGVLEYVGEMDPWF